MREVDIWLENVPYKGPEVQELGVFGWWELSGQNDNWSGVRVVRREWYWVGWGRQIMQGLVGAIRRTSASTLNMVRGHWRVFSRE